MKSCSLAGSLLHGRKYCLFSWGPGWWRMIRDQNAILDQVLDGLIIQRDLSMAGEMLQVCLNYRCSLPDNIFHNCLLLVGNRFPLNNADRSLRAGTNACTKTLTEEVTDKPCLP